MTKVTIYSRTGCHLCEDALKVLQSLKDELNFEINE
ncbi:MAG: Glutaredoxin-like domain, partial [Actinomycetota bacterium]